MDDNIIYDLKTRKLLKIGIDLKKVFILPIKRNLIFDFLLRRKKGKKRAEIFYLQCLEKRESLEEMQQIWINIINKYTQHIQESQIIQNFFKMEFNKVSLKSGEAFFSLKEIENLLYTILKKAEEVFLIAYKHYYLDLFILVYFLCLSILKRNR